MIRTRRRKKLARRARVLVSPAPTRNEWWSMDFMVDRLTDGRRFRILTVIDQYTRDCPVLVADTSLRAKEVVGALDWKWIVLRSPSP